jgi:hypothetical protein
VVVRQRFCEQCADDRLVEASTELVQQILRNVAVRSGRTVVVIKSNPTGAEIELDGTPMGATEASYGTYPGKHQVVLRKDGYVAETRELVVDEGKTAELSVTLQLLNPGTTRPPEEAPSRLVPGLAIGGGAVLVAFSGYALYRSVHDDAKFTYTRATPVAVVGGLLGVGAIGTGLYLMWRGPRTSAPTATVTGRAAVVGWMVAF